MRATVPFGEWLPDQLGQNGGLRVADNVIPVANGYAPFPAFVAESTAALPGYPLGAGAFRSGDGRTHILAGTATNLYRLRATGWQQIGAGYNATGDNNWTFEQFGDRVIATNGIDLPVYFDPANPATVTVLPNAPRMKLLTVVLDFLVGGVVDGNVMRLHWSGINNSEQWSFGVGQSDINDAATGGAITGITGGEYGLVLQEERITRMRYVGGNFIFQFDPLTREIGCIHHRSVAQLGRLTFFLSPRGFMVCDGSSVTPIGDEKVDRTFQAAASLGRLGKMSATVDPVRKIVAWTLPEDEPGVWFVYSWTLQRWARVLQPARLLFATRRRGATLGEDVNPQPDDNLLAGGLPFGDPTLAGGAPFVAAFDASNVFGAFTGAPMAAKLGAGPVTLAGGREARIRRARPVGDVSAGVTVRLAAERRLGDPATETVWSDLRSSGDIPVRDVARHVTASVEIAAGAPWTFMQGLDLEFEAGAKR
jgi:hypothetical protein